LVAWFSFVSTDRVLWFKSKEYKVMEGLWNLLAFLGAVVAGSSLICLVVWIGIWTQRLRRVVRDYHYSAPQPDGWGTSNLFQKFIDSNSEIRKRLYIAERNASNANFKIDMHVKDYKHTKTAKKVAIDKERKALEKERVHDDSVRGGDGM
jgi:hypothetical protein